MVLGADRIPGRGIVPPLVATWRVLSIAILFLALAREAIDLVGFQDHYAADAVIAVTHDPEHQGVGRADAVICLSFETCWTAPARTAWHWVIALNEVGPPRSMTLHDVWEVSPPDRPPRSVT